MKNKKLKIHKLFEVGVILKGLDGILEILGGILLWTVNPTSINKFIQNLTQQELNEDAHDLIANLFLHFNQSLSLNSKNFGAIYLLSHGIIKIALVVGLLQKKLWAYPASIIFLILFIVYQLYRLWLGYSVGMLLLTILDVIVITLVWLEYRNVKESL